MDPLRAFTEDQFREWVERDRRRKELKRESDQLDATNKILAGDVAKALAAAGKTEVRRGEFRATFVDGPRQPAWKDEFLRIVGEEAAATVVAATEPSRRISIAKV